ncbi:39S ribosomal protein L40, mitochondrial [Diorhabda sublineata]|uniref:39S ribosomal protein L40, mitochondrial n=1 Tax=Diorhabda sublineata TaxID=1163346 RepID=UPI0024E05C9C|nr:39S ribosomal protein L40, mitochondrial [Diorhabda sublineata]
MSINNLIFTFSRLTCKIPTVARTISTNSQLLFKCTPILLAEPLKKKKKLDPAIIKAREERKKRKIEKQIRRLEKNARQLKPIEECEVPLEILDTLSTRKRYLAPPSPEILEKRALLLKKWCHYKREQHLADMQMLDRIAYSQQKALDELRKESEELYQEAVQSDFQLLPFVCQGPVETPPIKHYNSPDGDYQDVSKKW